MVHLCQPPSHSQAVCEILNNQNSMLPYHHVCFIWDNLHSTFYATVCCSRHKDALHLTSRIKKKNSVLLHVLYISNRWVRYALFLDFRQHRMVVSCWRFGTTCWSHPQGSSSPRRFLKMELIGCPKRW
jgi:hypothetical protein